MGIISQSDINEYWSTDPVTVVVSGNGTLLPGTVEKVNGS
jgi:hypothetical protein